MGLPELVISQVWKLGRWWHVSLELRMVAMEANPNHDFSILWGLCTVNNLALHYNEART